MYPCVAHVIERNENAKRNTHPNSRAKLGVCVRARPNQDEAKQDTHTHTRVQADSVVSVNNLKRARSRSGFSAKIPESVTTTLLCLYVSLSHSFFSSFMHLILFTAVSFDRVSVFVKVSVFVCVCICVYVYMSICEYWCRCIEATLRNSNDAFHLTFCSNRFFSHLMIIS